MAADVLLSIKRTLLVKNCQETDFGVYTAKYYNFFMNARLTESAPIYTNLKPVPQPEVEKTEDISKPEVVKKPIETSEPVVIIEPGVDSLPEYAPVPEIISKPEVVHTPEVIEKPEVIKEPEVRPDSKPEIKEEVKPEVKQKIKSELRSEVKPEVKSEVEPEVKPEAKLRPVIDFTKLEVPKSYIKPDISEQENFIVAFGGWNFAVPKETPKVSPEVKPEEQPKVKSDPPEHKSLSTPKPTSGPIKSPQVQPGIFQPSWKIFSLNSPEPIDVMKNKK